MNAVKYQKSDLAFIEDLLDDCFYTFEVELTRRRLAAAYHAQAPQKNCGSKIMEVTR